MTMITREQASEIARKCAYAHCPSEFVANEYQPPVWVADAIVQAYELGAKREWMPIETAPTGVEVLIALPLAGTGPDIGLAVARQYPENSHENAWWGDNQNIEDSFFQPTHWMPLPPPPETKT